MAGQILNVFNSRISPILAGTVDLANDTFYAHLVTVIPDIINDNLVSDLVLASYTGYAPATGLGTSYSSGSWVISSPINFPTNTGVNEVIVGMVICRQLGGSPAASDEVVLFQRSRIGNSYVNVNVNTNNFPSIALDGTGVLNVTDTLIGYASGSYQFYLDTNGLIYLIGTQGGLTSYSNPETSNQIAAIAISSPERLFDRTSVNTNLGNGAAYGILDFQPGDMRVGINNSTLMIRHRCNQGGSSGTARLWGAHELVSGLSVNDTRQWDELGSLSIPFTSSYTTQTYAMPGNANHYRYLMLRTDQNLTGSWQVEGIDFYDATVAKTVAW